MKKLLLLFILSIAISSCSNDDNATKTSLEGKWYVSYSSPISKTNFTNLSLLKLENEITYQFTNNMYAISSTLFIEKGTFTYNKNNDNTIVELIPDNPNFLTSTYTLKFSNNNSVVEFRSQNEPSTYFELTKIQ